MSFINDNLNVFGLDLSNRSIKVAQLKKKNNKMQLYAYNRENVPKGLIKNGEIESKEEIVELIKKTLRNAKINPIRSKFVIYSIPEPKGFIRVVKIKKSRGKNINEMIRNEAEQLFPINIDESYIDWQKLPSENKNEAEEFLVAAVSRNLVDSYSEILREAGLKPIAAEIESIAISRSLIDKKRIAKPVLIIDLGKDRTSFIIFKSPSVQFTASIPICGEEIIKITAKKINVSEKKAEEMINECGLVLKDDCQNVYNTIQPPMYEMIKYVSKLINYYKEHYKAEADIAKVIICGGEAKMPGLSSFLSLRIKKEVEKGNPWVNISSSEEKEIPPLSVNDSMIFVTVLGLALRGVKHFNY